MNNGTVDVDCYDIKGLAMLIFTLVVKETSWGVGNEVT